MFSHLDAYSMPELIGEERVSKIQADERKLNTEKIELSKKIAACQQRLQASNNQTSQWQSLVESSLGENSVELMLLRSEYQAQALQSEVKLY